MTRMTAQQYKAHLKTTRPYLLVELGENERSRRTDTRLREPSGALEIAAFAFVILLSVSMHYLLAWIKSWPIWGAL